MIQENITAQREVLSTETAAKFVKSAMKYQSKLELDKNGHRANPKSLLGVLCLEIEAGSSLLLTSSGPDEKEAIEELMSFLNASSQKKVYGEK